MSFLGGAAKLVKLISACQGSILQASFLAHNSLNDISPRINASHNDTEPRCFVNLEKESVDVGIRSCKLSLVGWILTRKPINKGVIEEKFTSIWNNSTGFKVEEIKPRMFQFFFAKEAVKKRVLC